MKAWFKLNQTDIPQEILTEWEQLLLDTDNGEEVYQKFLSNHSRFFLPKVSDYSDQIIIEKLKFGADYISDFVLCDNQRSNGFKYTLVELESPHTPAFTKSKKQSARLRDAIQQIRDWKHWIDSNRDSAKRIFPSKRFVSGNVLNFDYLVILGRRKDHAVVQDKINFLSKDAGIQIRSYDYLTDILKNRRFMTFTNITQDLLGPSKDQNNEFTNPFCKPFSDKNWRKIVGDSRFVNSHMVANNIDILLPELTHNDVRLSQFEKELTKLGNTIEQWEYNVLP